jgi:ATP-dependent helicase HepA
LIETLVDGGVDAISDLTAAWQSEDDALSLDEELRRIENQDLLDELEAVEAEHEDIYDELEAYEYATDPSLFEQFSREFDGWASRCLQLRRDTTPDKHGAVEYEHTNRTLLAANRFSEIFRDSFHRERRRRGLCTGWMHADRSQAAKQNLPILRVGNPFVEDMCRLLESDDRGRAYACWREIADYDNEYETGNSADLFYRFDFLVEANVVAQRERVAELGLAPGAVSRRAEDAFPPMFRTIWIDIDGVQVTDKFLVADLESPHDRSKDTNLRDTHWKTIDDMGIVANWARVCDAAFASALACLQEATELDERVTQALRRTDRRFKAARQQIETRIAVLDKAEGEIEALRVERNLHECLRSIISSPRIRLDSIGAVFLSGRNPFEQTTDA